MADAITFTQGETVSFLVTITDADGLPVDISADTFVAKICDASDLAVALATFTCSVIDAEWPETVKNRVRCILPSDDSATIQPNYTYNSKGILNTAPSAVYILGVYRVTDNGVDPDIIRQVAGGTVGVLPTAYLGA